MCPPHGCITQLIEKKSCYIGKWIYLNMCNMGIICSLLSVNCFFISLTFRKITNLLSSCLIIVWGWSFSLWNWRRNYLGITVMIHLLFSFHPFRKYLCYLNLWPFCGRNLCLHINSHIGARCQFCSILKNARIKLLQTEPGESTLLGPSHN